MQKIREKQEAAKKRRDEKERREKEENREEKEQIEQTKEEKVSFIIWVKCKSVYHIALKHLYML